MARVIAVRLTNVRFAVGPSTIGRPTWWLYDERDNLVAWAGGTFDTMAEARRAAQLFKEGAVNARYDSYKDEDGMWQWRAWLRGSTAATSGHGFAKPETVTRAAENVRADAGFGTGV